MLLAPELSDQSSSIGHARFFPDPLRADIEPPLFRLGFTRHAEKKVSQPDAMRAVLGNATSVVLRPCFLVRPAETNRRMDTLCARLRVCLSLRPLFFCGARFLLCGAGGVLAELIDGACTAASFLLLFGRTSNHHWNKIGPRTSCALRLDVLVTSSFFSFFALRDFHWRLVRPLVPACRIKTPQRIITCAVVYFNVFVFPVHDACRITPHVQKTSPLHCVLCTFRTPSSRR